MSDNGLVYEVEKIVYEDREVEVIVEKEIYIDDTGDLAADIWVDNFKQPSVTDGVDILWVIDPSGSMSNDRAQILDGINDMMLALPLTGWRLAIIPTDYRKAEMESQFPLVPGDTAIDAELMMNNAITGNYEAGFDAVYGYIFNNSYAQTWLRHDAALLVVFVSDEEEQSFEYVNSAHQFVTWISGVRQSVFLASIVNLDPAVSDCNSSLANAGMKYIEATNTLNGNVIDICSEDWSSGVAEASNQLQEIEYWDLTFTPLYEDRIHVFIDGVEQPDIVGTDVFWHYEPLENRIYFDKIPQGGSLVEIAYYYQ